MEIRRPAFEPLDSACIHHALQITSILRSAKQAEADGIPPKGRVSGIPGIIYDFRTDLLPAARQWIFERFQVAISRGLSPIVIDRGNGLNRESQIFASYALDHNYRAELREPESEWWQEIRVLLKYKELTRPILDQWVDRLAEISRGSHCVPAETIRSWMTSWTKKFRRS